MRGHICKNFQFLYLSIKCCLTDPCNCTNLCNPCLYTIQRYGLPPKSPLYMKLSTKLPITPNLIKFQITDNRRVADRKIYESKPLLLGSEVANLVSITVGMQFGMSTIFLITLTYNSHIQDKTDHAYFRGLKASRKLFQSHLDLRSSGSFIYCF
jgi:hypothetical protein